MSSVRLQDGSYRHPKEPRPLSQIAVEIKKEWPNIPPHAEAYREPMSYLRSVEEDFGLDSGRSVVLYFLSNAGTWRGEKARAIKSELKDIVGRQWFK